MGLKIVQITLRKPYFEYIVETFIVLLGTKSTFLRFFHGEFHLNTGTIYVFVQFICFFKNNNIEISKSEKSTKKNLK